MNVINTLTYAGKDHRTPQITLRFRQPPFLVYLGAVERLLNVINDSFSSYIFIDFFLNL